MSDRPPVHAHTHKPLDRRSFVKFSGALLAAVKLIPLAEVLAPPAVTSPYLPPITLTPEAAAEVLHVARSIGILEGARGRTLRLGYTVDEDQTFRLLMGFDEEVDPADDVVTEMHGLRVAVSRQCMDKLRGTLVEFYHRDEKRGFTFDNPQWATGSARA
jgi:Fe-S cluster assembly iron-binding protein IscA